ncbi:hypothetical protein AVEN_262191-1 [Araneus ventricosus]|uniref:Uncharacterized protein n=1 Tax=Araneus ventricosus TaxID=182803 RepID=A0A4Y2TWG6_ARAVE|nr:hypothetical protein AVEN_262191-1 [Araneus ventricosus]
MNPNQKVSDSHPHYKIPEWLCDFRLRERIPPRIYNSRISVFTARQSKWRDGYPYWLDIQLSAPDCCNSHFLCADDRFRHGAVNLHGVELS